jgi:hypothetical protein
MIRALAFVTALVASVALAAGSTGVVAQVFRGGTDVVSLNVTVTEGEALVPGLDQALFSVYEDGVQQDITYFSRTPQPIALSLLIDTSTSMEHKLAVARDIPTWRNRSCRRSRFAGPSRIRGSAR